MKLDRLEILGFKSFAEPVTIVFNRGITAVVGPNGCGKTNITDAIRWVLGEQRPTALRGSNLQEVIFNGTRHRGPLGLAEVTLSFTNTLNLIATAYSEVSITRRVFRDGETEYFLNKAPCNLKDIRDLFLGTGVGSSAYSVIEQKMVDAILSERAEERRLLFEEAAGVTRYKARRKATLRKLESTEEDLRRLGDILGEVRKNTNSLRRQVGKARRFEELQREELRLAVALAQLDLAEVGAREVPLRESIQRLMEVVERGTVARSVGEAEVERLDGELSRKRGEARSVRDELEQLAADLQNRERDRLLAAEGRRRALSESERLEREIEDHHTQTGALTSRREALQAPLAEAVSRAKAGREEAFTRQAAVEDLTRRFETLQSSTREARARRERLSEERFRVEADLAGARAERQAALVRQDELRASLADLSGAAPGERIDESLEERVEADRRRARQLVEGETEELERRSGARSEAERQLADAELALTELSARRREIAARKDTLEELQEESGGYGAAARRVLERGSEVAPGIRGPLVAEVEVRDTRYLAAVEAFLDLWLDALVTPTIREARAVLEFWRGSGCSGAVWPLDQSGDEGLPALSAEAREHVLCTGPGAARLKGELERHSEALFRRLLLTRDLAGAVALRRALQVGGAAPSYVIVALTGEILEPCGFLRLGGKRASAHGLERFQQAEELSRRATQITEDIATAEVRLRATRERLDVTIQDEQAGRARLEEARAEVERLDRELSRLRGAREADLGRASELATQLALVEEKLEAQHARDAECNTLAREIQRQIAAAELEHGTSEAELEEVRIAREAGLRDLAAAELASEQRSAALLSLQREERYLGDAEDEQRSLAAQKRRDSEAERERAESLESQEREIAGAVAEMSSRLQELRARVVVLDEAARVLEAERVACETEARARRAAHEEARQELHREEMRLADLVHRRESIRTIIETEFGQPLETLSARAEAQLAGVPPERGAGGEILDTPPERGDLLPAAGAADAESLRRDLLQLREKKAALGPVNLLALEEFSTEKERLDFLEAQYADLVRGRDQLREAIRRINDTARELFTDTFIRARENFQATFGTLFEGGHADITLADQADPLESAIEISASPRGKRVQAVNLLSGGERALTALSLLFAIYLVKPSPFCILDEVDAPLDDANIGRFLHMLKTFSDRTQFIVVTHNKRTMEAADFLYGVTMEEPGVSTLVSVDFERRHGFDYEAIQFGRRGGNGAGVHAAPDEPPLLEDPDREEALVGD